ncbi:TPA: ABC transporter permease, partial [Thermoplasmata archaeon]|nr:ABC transporter permease [Thermoplasmata archaeon]
MIDTNFTLSGPFAERMRLLRKKVVETGRVFKRNRMGMLGLTILIVFAAMAVFPAQIMWVFSTVGGWEYPYGPHDEVAPYGGADPSSEHWLGTDSRGNDVLARVIYGARISLIIGVLAAAVAMVLGSIVGLLSGFWGGWRDEVLMRVTDVFLVLPWLVLMIVFVAVLPGGPSVYKIIIVIGITGWAGTARIVRTQVLSVKKRAFIERARSVGAGEFHIIRKHIFPNVFPLIFANAILTVALAILSESALSFLGMGAAATVDVTWG